MAAEQSRLHTKLEKTRDRVNRMRTDQSVTEYGLKEDLKELKRAQQPVVELKFESVDGVFTMKDLHPDAAAAWRRFVREMVKANEGMMFPNDPTGRVVALPRKTGNAA
jgi:type IV secretory pathway VirD2 relaxase